MTPQAPTPDAVEAALDIYMQDGFTAEGVGEAERMRALTKALDAWRKHVRSLETQAEYEATLAALNHKETL